MIPAARAAIAAMILAVTAAACGGSAVADRAGRAGSPASSSAASASVDPSSSAAASSTPKPGETADPDGDHDHEGETTTTGKYSVEEPPPTTFRRADSGESTSGSGKVPLELKIEPGCVDPGNTLVVTARTKPDVQVGLLTNLPGDAAGRGQEYRGRSDARGLMTWTISVLPKTTPGNYSMFGAAADDKGNDGGRSGTWIFIVGQGDCSS